MVWMSLLLSLQLAADEKTDWPGFRGSDARGVADGYVAPLQWDANDAADSSILWKSVVPGLGHSSPVVFGDKIFLATAISVDGKADLQLGRSGNIQAAEGDGQQTWAILCYNKKTGKQLWRRDAHTGTPRVTRHAKATHANTTVAVDNRHVVAFFGSEGIYCYDHDGHMLWQRDLGVVNISKYNIGWGYASSPAIYADRVVLVCDAPDDPYLAALDLETGEQVWRKSRMGDCERSWGTALIHGKDGDTQVVVNGWPWIVSYELATGEERWRIEGGGDNPTPTPFAVGENIYITNAHGGKAPIIVVAENARGNLTEDEEAAKSIVWSRGQGGSYMSTPVVYGEYLYLGNTNGIIRCFNATTGAEVYEKRLGNGASIFASLVAADGKIYCPSEDGTIYVINAGPEFEVLAENPMGEPCFASPAISAGTLYIRTTSTLVAIAAKDASTDDSSGEHSNEVESAKGDQADNGTRRRNVLFIAVDDLRPSLGCYGDRHAITPNIDRLADRGIRFNRAYCQVAVCNPSRASLMTGLRPDKLGVWTLPIHFREAMPDAVTIPQWFRKFGYTAVSHGKIFHNPTPDPQSWSEVIRGLPKLLDPYPEGTSELVRLAMEELPKDDWRKNNLRRPSSASPELDDRQVLDGAQTDLAIEDLRRLSKKEKPFFLAMGYIRPHLAWVAPKKYWDLYDPTSLPVRTQQNIIENTPAYAPHNNSELSHYVDLIDMPKPWDDGELPEEKVRHLLHAYYACVSYVDAQIGRLLEALEEEGVAENTIDVLGSDHGWKLGEHRGWGKMTNYEIDTRVPLLLSAPGLVTAGESTDSLVELLDVFPSLCELAGIAMPDFVDGKSLVSLAKDPQSKIRDQAISQYYRKHEGREYMGYSMRTDRYRYIEWRDFGTGEVVDRELYDHSQIDTVDGLIVEDVNVANVVETSVIESLAEQLVASAPRRKLVMTPSVHSSPSPQRWKSDLTISNRSTVELKVYPITTAGRRGQAKRIEANQDATFSARIGGVYVIERVDGRIHQIHSPAWPPVPVVVQ